MAQLQQSISSRSPAMTEAIGEAIGRSLRGGETIELSSDLGGGKTTLTHGIAQGAGSQDAVASPTFTIGKVYTAGHLQLHHFDFYRLEEAGIMQDELAELIGDPAYVVLVEWSGVVQDVLPEERLTIKLEATGEDDRRITLTYPETLTYLVQALTEAA